MSKCFEDFVSQALGFLTRNYIAEIRSNKAYYAEVFLNKQHFFVVIMFPIGLGGGFHA